eukprot:COSAG01_NODE_13839_length_1528_cov_1.241428_2_plen_124_part_00
MTSLCGAVYVQFIFSQPSCTAVCSPPGAAAGLSLHHPSIHFTGLAPCGATYGLGSKIRIAMADILTGMAQNALSDHQQITSTGDLKADSGAPVSNDEDTDATTIPDYFAQVVAKPLCREIARD